jgi:hypothetical protein
MTVTELVEYVHLRPETPLPDMAALSPFRVVVIAESAVSNEWQSLVSSWLVNLGCLCMMAWGVNCSTWDDSVDMANIEKFGFDGIPENYHIMTTWHDHDSLDDVFLFSKNKAFDPNIEIPHTILLDISLKNRKSEILKAYVDA